MGILRRAVERGKELPEKLKRALEIQAGLVLPDGRPTKLEAYHIQPEGRGDRPSRRIRSVDGD